ncbi:hypothetical protein DXA97_06205 [Clostridium sp. OF09-36]|nr:hypothetical protein DW922_04625 [Clostridium sp. AM42-4]RHV88754.1 hypothetical protein DXA97_06205 [Clostridium sp. OF09-36]HBM47685.1 hypothetical protein [Lachnoclostridium sp.]
MIRGCFPFLLQNWKNLLILTFFLNFPLLFCEKNLLFFYACTTLMLQVVESGAKWFEMVQKCRTRVLSWLLLMDM